MEENAITIDTNSNQMYTTYVKTLEKIVTKIFNNQILQRIINTNIDKINNTYIFPLNWWSFTEDEKNKLCQLSKIICHENGNDVDDEFDNELNETPEEYSEFDWKNIFLVNKNSKWYFFISTIIDDNETATDFIDFILSDGYKFEIEFNEENLNALHELIKPMK